MFADAIAPFDRGPAPRYNLTEIPARKSARCCHELLEDDFVPETIDAEVAQRQAGFPSTWKGSSLKTFFEGSPG